MGKTKPKPKKRDIDTLIQRKTEEALAVPGADPSAVLRTVAQMQRIEARRERMILEREKLAVQRKAANASMRYVRLMEKRAIPPPPPPPRLPADGPIPVDMADNIRATYLLPPIPEAERGAYGPPVGVEAPQQRGGLGPATLTQIEAKIWGLTDDLPAPPPSPPPDEDEQAILADLEASFKDPKPNSL